MPFKSHLCILIGPSLFDYVEVKIRIWSHCVSFSVITRPRLDPWSNHRPWRSYWSERLISWLSCSLPLVRASLFSPSLHWKEQDNSGGDSNGLAQGGHEAALWPTQLEVWRLAQWILYAHHYRNHADRLSKPVFAVTSFVKRTTRIYPTDQRLAHILPFFAPTARPKMLAALKRKVGTSLAYAPFGYKLSNCL